jgi:hypothetical protein
MDEAEVARHGRADRLAELVVHLTECEPERALHLIDLSSGSDLEVDELDVVARAMVRLRRTGVPQRPSIDLRQQVKASEDVRK